MQLYLDFVLLMRNMSLNSYKYKGNPYKRVPIIAIKSSRCLLEAVNDTRL